MPGHDAECVARMWHNLSTVIAGLDPAIHDESQRVCVAGYAFLPYDCLSFVMA